MKIFKKKSGHKWEDRAQANTNAHGKYRTEVEARVAQAGGKIADSGSVCFCLSWDDKVDLDIHCKLPSYNENLGYEDKDNMCYYANKNPKKYISLDVDKQAHDYGKQVENIVLKTAGIPDGVYKYFVRYYSGHGGPVDFKFVLNEFGKKIHQGIGTSRREPTKDCPVADVTIEDG